MSSYHHDTPYMPLYSNTIKNDVMEENQRNWNGKQVLPSSEQCFIETNARLISSTPCSVFWQRSRNSCTKVACMVYNDISAETWLCWWCDAQPEWLAIEGHLWWPSYTVSERRGDDVYFPPGSVLKLRNRTASPCSPRGPLAVVTVLPSS